MRYEDYSRRILREQAPKLNGRNSPESLLYMSGTFSPGSEPLPAKYSMRWLWTGWSYTGADPSKTEYVYLLGRNDKLLKIGYSNDPIRRVAELTGALQRRVYLIGTWMHPEAGWLEKKVHAALRPRRGKHEREWFRVSRQEAFAAIFEAMVEIDAVLAREAGQAS